MDHASEAALAPQEPVLSIWKIGAAVAALAMIFGLIEAAQLRLGSGVLGRPMPFQLAAARVLPYWLLFACVLPLAAALARRSRIARSVLKPTLPHLAITAVCFGLLVLAGRMLVPTIDPRNGVRLQSTPMQLFQTYFVLDVLTYTALVGTLYAFHYYREARSRELTAARLEASLAEARLKGLEAQVDPEFLFSALNTISNLATKGEQKAVVETLGRLSELLRSALNDEPTDEIPLGAEVESFKERTMCARSSSRPVAIDYQIAPDVRSALVPRAMLAPLVEHALIAGAADAGNARRIRITACKRSELVLELEIVDTATWTTAPDAPDDATALSQLRRRLRDLYGRAFALDVNTSGRGGNAVICIPFRLALVGEDRTRTISVA